MSESENENESKNEIYEKTPKEIALEIVRRDLHPRDEYVWWISLRTRIEKAITEAVVVERSACAKIAQDYANDYEEKIKETDSFYDRVNLQGLQTASRIIAFLIRRRK